jgi:hypothetical protein
MSEHVRISARRSTGGKTLKILVKRRAKRGVFDGAQHRRTRAEAG